MKTMTSCRPGDGGSSSGGGAACVAKYRHGEVMAHSRRLQTVSQHVVGLDLNSSAAGGGGGGGPMDIDLSGRLCLVTGAVRISSYTYKLPHPQ